MRSRTRSVSLNRLYSEGGDTLYVMDQISDKKNKEESLAGKSFAQRGDEPPRGEGETHH